MPGKSAWNFYISLFHREGYSLFLNPLKSLAMKKAFASLLPMVVSLLLISSCDRKAQVPAFDRSYREYINAFTSGVISRKSTIKIHFAQKAKEQPTKEVLEFEPEIEGKLVWIDDQSLEFIPD